jgi:hypothetical protein
MAPRIEASEWHQTRCHQLVQASAEDTDGIVV